MLCFQGLGCGVNTSTTGGSHQAGSTATSSLPTSTLQPASNALKPIRVPILAYHYVDLRPLPGPTGLLLTLSYQTFEQEMNYLVANGYHTISLDRAYRALSGLENLPSKPVVITFDDGGLDNYTEAFPILKARHMTATFFVVPGFVGTKRHASWSQLAQMSKSGMSIESHSLRHYDLTKENPDILKMDLQESRNLIEGHIGVPVRFLAYPGGKYDAAVINAAKLAGYAACLSMKPGSNLSLENRYFWPRLGIGHFETLADFRAALLF